MMIPAGMYHYSGYFFGYLFGLFPAFLGIIFFVKFDLFKNNPDFCVLILIFFK